MDKKNLLQYKKMLLGIKEKIVSQIKQISSDASSPHKDASGDISGHALHMADVATDMYDREFSLGLASNDRELLYQVEEALQRIEDNTFGYCQECGKSIPLARLKAIPYTPTCMKCQEKLETK
jgi:RNA polymerase-binding protein DksA